MFNFKNFNIEQLVGAIAAILSIVGLVLGLSLGKVPQPPAPTATPNPTTTVTSTTNAPAPPPTTSAKPAPTPKREETCEEWYNKQEAPTFYPREDAAKRDTLRKDYMRDYEGGGAMHRDFLDKIAYDEMIRIVPCDFGVKHPTGISYDIIDGNGIHTGVSIRIDRIPASELEAVGFKPYETRGWPSDRRNGMLYGISVGNYDGFYYVVLSHKSNTPE